MYEKQIQKIKQRLQVKGDQVFTTSLDVARIFGKEHYHVLRDIESLACPEEFNALNFEAVNYADAKGEHRPMYNITRKGFVLLVMGYTGKRAMVFKIAYIEAFDMMEAELIKRSVPAIAERLTPEYIRWHNTTLMKWRKKSYTMDMAAFFARRKHIDGQRFYYVMDLRREGMKKCDAAKLMDVSPRQWGRIEREFLKIQQEYAVREWDESKFKQFPSLVLIGQYMDLLPAPAKAVLQ